MRTFHIRRVDNAPDGRTRLLVHDTDNIRFRAIEAPGLELAKLQAVVAIKQVLLREEEPMPECDGCLGGIARIGDSLELCSNEACREWYRKGMTILDRVEVAVTTEGDVGEVVL